MNPLLVFDSNHNRLPAWGVTTLKLRLRLLGSYMLSSALSLLAGYGYRPARAFGAYLLIIFGFAALYLWLGHLSFLSPAALVFSITSFHGRGFAQIFPGVAPNTHRDQVLVTFSSN